MDGGRGRDEPALPATRRARPLPRSAAGVRQESIPGLHQQAAPERKRGGSKVVVEREALCVGGRVMYPRKEEERTEGDQCAARLPIVCRCGVVW